MTPISVALHNRKISINGLSLGAVFSIYVKVVKTIQ
jgi:hypothetical protein